VNRNILTFGRLAKWAASLSKHDKENFKALKTDVPLALYDPSPASKDWVLQSSITHVYMRFTVTRKDGDVGRRHRPTNVTITGVTYKGKLYSWYQFQITPTKYQANFFQRFMPIHMPTGPKLRSKRMTVPMEVRNADGSHSFSDYWENSSTGRSGYPCHHVVINESTGRVLPPSEAGDVISGFDPLCHNGEATLGWFPKAVGYEEFMESITQINHIRPEWGNVVEPGKMQVVANRAIHAALRFVESVPGSKMKLFPARDAKDSHAFWHNWNHFGDTGRVARLSWDDGSNRRMFSIVMPEVFVCWPKEGQWMYSSMFVPPLGNPYLDFSIPQHCERFGGVLGRAPGQVKCAYQTLGVLDRDLCDPDMHNWQKFYPGSNQAAPELLFNFANSDDHIMCLTLPAATNNTYERWKTLARRPEDALSGFLEKALVDSLPLA
jgi:hypothetical protein